MVLGAAGASGAAAPAQVVGAAKAIPMEQALQRSQLAAEAVILRRGKETCLRGKLTNALLGLSASCEAAGQRSGLCALAHQAGFDFVKHIAILLIKFFMSSNI